jgi:hypothetical protein
MAVALDLSSSSNAQIIQSFSDSISEVNTQKSLVTPRLHFNCNEFVWDGNLDELKEFVQDDLQLLNGKWSSPGGEVKLFTNPTFAFKWYGTTKKKIVIVTDNEELYLAEMLRKHADEYSGEDNEHVAVEFENANDESVNQSDMSSNCNNCQKHREELDEIKLKLDSLLSLYSVVGTKQSELEIERNKYQLIEGQDGIIHMLINKNRKLESELDNMKVTLEQVKLDNELIQKTFDMKQNVWIKAKSSNHCNQVPVPDSPQQGLSTFNHFDTLTVEDDDIPVNTSDSGSGSGFQGQIKDYRNSQSSKFVKKLRKTDQNTSSVNSHSECPPNNQSPSEQKKVLIIGDSMVKNIDNLKISRAAKTKSTQCHSYSGARIQHLEEKIKEHWSDDSQNYEAVIIHAGTNNLVNESPHQVAQRMESLIKVAKIHSSDVAVSSVVKRFDGKLSNQKIEEANNLLLILCKRYEVAFLDNSEIDQSHLNRSNLHLNRNGDKLLGKQFCSYLKLVKISRNAVHNQKLHGKNKPFFRLVLGHRMKEWSDHLKLVTNIMKK